MFIFENTGVLDLEAPSVEEFRNAEVGLRRSFEFLQEWTNPESFNI